MERFLRCVPEDASVGEAGGKQGERRHRRNREDELSVSRQTKLAAVALSCISALTLIIGTSSASAQSDPKRDAARGAFVLAQYIKDDVSAGRRLHYVFITNDLTIPYAQAIHAGVDRAKESIDADIDFTGPATGKPEEQVAVLQTLVTQQKVDGIAVAATNVNSLKPAMDAAYAAGIPVISVFTDQPNSQELAYVGQDNVATGQLAAKLLISALGETKGDIVLLSVDTAAAWSQARVKGFEQGVANASGWKVIGPVNTTTEPAQMQSAVDNAMRANPNAVAIASIDCCSTTAAAKWVADNKPSTKVIASGADALASSITSIKAGDLTFTISQNPVEMVKTSLQMLDGFVRKGEPLKDIPFPALIVTKDNAAQVTPEG